MSINSRDYDDAAGVGDLDGPHDLVAAKAHWLERRGMASHERVGNGKDEWLTPQEIVQSLGDFDLDPCSPIKRPWPTAAHHYTIADDAMSTWFSSEYTDSKQARRVREIVEAHRKEHGP